MTIKRDNETGQNDRCGLFSWTSAGELSLPLKAVEGEFSVVGGIADVAMRQHFVHGDAKLGAIDCIYTFPLTGGAAVHECELTINGRIVRAQAMEETWADDFVESAAAAGHRTLQIEPERDNLFTLSLNNLQPGDELIVALRYFHTVEAFGSERPLRIPFTPGVRYVPLSHLAEIERLSPPHIDRSVPAAAKLNLTGTVNLDGIADSAPPSSPTHSVLIESTEDASMRIALDSAHDFPDRDFVLRWENLLCEGVAFAAVDAEEEGEVAALELHPPSMEPHVVFECKAECQSEEHCCLIDLFRIGIEDLELPDEVARLLTDGEIPNIGLLASKTEADLKSLGLSKTEIELVEERLQEFGLTLGMQFDPSLLDPARVTDADPDDGLEEKILYNLQP